MRALLAWILIVTAALAHGASRDDDFLAAREAYRVGDARKLNFYAERLRGYLLEPYVTYWRLRRRLEKAPVDEIRAFMAANRDSPLSDRLLREWLKLLGDKQEWDLFDAELPQLVSDDIEITCYSLQSRLRTDPEALREARPLWFVPRNLPDSCDPLFAALASARMLSKEDIWTRIRLALERGQVGLVRKISKFLPAAEAPDNRVLKSISSNPARYLAKQHFHLKSRVGREATMFAVYRLARISPQQAATHWTRLGERFTADERAYVWGLIAYYGARKLDPGALEWYSQAGSNLSDVQLAWKARAGLRAGDWNAVLAAIQEMTRQESQQENWRYWKARALRALGRSEEAIAILRPLSREFNFYGQLATEDLGGEITHPPTTFTPTAPEMRAVSGLPGIQRALVLYRLALRIYGLREWLWAIRGFDDRKLLTAAHVALRNDIYDRAINTAEKTADLHDFTLRYLAPYRDVLKAYADKMGLDEAWVYGLIRQESRFIADARSRSGAIGLMQLMPGTAKWVARKLGLRRWRWSEAREVDTNVSLGTYYLRHVLDLLDGYTVLASAGYNAGPGRARAWRPDTAIEGAVYTETIPFNETRDYVKKVMANATYYAQVFDQGARSLKERLGTILPPSPAGEIPLGDTP